MTAGLIHFYYGYGKGKTTAAMGLAVRASGYDKKVVIVQFLKNTKSGEIAVLSALENVTVFRGTAVNKFYADMTEEERNETRRIHGENLDKALELVRKNECDLLILDEVIDAYQKDLMDRDLLQKLVREKPEELELVITGHKPEEWLIEEADYVTEMTKIKHPYDQGIAARKSIEF